MISASVSPMTTSGDSHLNELLRQIWERLHRWAKLELSNDLRRKMTSEDLVQDTVLSFLPTLRALDARTAEDLEAILRRVLRNRARDASDRFMAQKRRLDREVHVTTSTMNAFRDGNPEQTNPEKVAMTDEERELLRLAIMMCSASHREVLIAFLEEGGKFARIGHRLGIASDAARKRHSRALCRVQAITIRLRRRDLRGASDVAEEGDREPPDEE